MQRTRKSTLPAFELLPLVLEDRLIIVPLCGLCGKPIIDPKKAIIFSVLEDPSNEKPHPIGTLKDGAHQIPIFDDGHTLHVAHGECLHEAETKREFTVVLWKPLDAVLRMDQQTDRDRAFEGTL